MRNQKSLTGCTFGILGESYSTFEGYIPQDNRCYYPREGVSDVRNVEECWWHILMQRNDMNLIINDSYSGATVCTTVREGLPFSSAFTERVRRSFSGAMPMDIIFVFGATNDSWLNRPVGQVKFSDRTQEDVKQVLPAYCDVLEYIAEHNSEALVVSVINTQLQPEIHAGMLRANAHYGAVTVELQDIHKENGHPSVLGMRQIAEQIRAALK